MLLLVALSASLAVFGLVVLKMLPFDNKSEVQIVVDLPEGRPLEQTNALLLDIAQWSTVPEVLDFQGYAGTSAPVNFNGLVRQYYLRSGSNVGDLQVNLVDKHHRDRQSHDIARELRPRLAADGAALRRQREGGRSATWPAGACRLWSPRSTGRITRAAAKLAQRSCRACLPHTEGIVDVDTSVEAAAPREMLVIDRARAARLGVSQAAVVATLQVGVAGVDATWCRRQVALSACRCGCACRPADQARMRRSAGAARARRAAASWCRLQSW